MSQGKKSYLIRQFLLFYCFAFLILLILHGIHLFNWQLFSDDLFIMSYADSYRHHLIGLFTNMAGQYRPIPYLFYSLYSVISTHSLWLYLINLGLFSLTPAIFMFTLNSFTRKNSIFIPYLLTLPFLLSPIFFYPVYNLSSLSGTLMLIIINLLLFNLVQVKPLLPSRLTILFCLVCVSLFVKESCLVAGGIYGLILIKNYRHQPKKLTVTLITLLICTFSIYGMLHLLLFRSGDSNYHYQLTSSTLVNNLVHFSAWLNDYPKGWQYGTPVTPKILAIPLSLITIIFSVFFLIVAARKNLNLFIFLMASLGLTLLPYLFLNRVLVFYLDQAYTVLFLTISLGWLALFQRSKILGGTFLGIILIASLLKFALYFPQWQKYSFVGVAQAIARNYLKTLQTVDLQQYRQVCILSHHEGSWATEDGRLATRLYGIPIVSTDQNQLPPSCNQQQDLILINGSRDYLKIN